MEAAMGQPKEVRILDLSGKGLTTFPRQIFKFKNLEEIDLSPEQLLIFRGTTPQAIKGNDIPSIPEDISKLRNLRSLNLQGTNLKTLPYGLVNLEQLSYLDLSYNAELNAKTVMLIVPKLTGLRFLDLSGCDISIANILILKEKMPGVVIQH